MSEEKDFLDFTYRKVNGDLYCEDCETYIGRGKKALLEHQGQKHYSIEGDEE
jgi:hypothetical protein